MRPSGFEPLTYRLEVVLYNVYAVFYMRNSIEIVDDVHGVKTSLV